MALSYYFDQHVPGAITRGLRLRDIDVLTAYEDGANRMDDPDLLLRATDLKRVLFSQDEDLLAIAHRFQNESRHFSGLVYAHQLGISIGRCISDLEILAKASTLDEMANHVEETELERGECGA